MEVLIPNATTIVQMAIFLAAYVMLKALLFEPFLAHLERRDAQTAGGAAADLSTLRDRAAAAEGAVAAALDEARRHAGAERERLLHEAQVQADAILAEGRTRAAQVLEAAKAEVDRAEGQARSELDAAVAPLARQAAAKLTGAAA